MSIFRSDSEFWGSDANSLCPLRNQTAGAVPITMGTVIHALIWLWFILLPKWHLGHCCTCPRKAEHHFQMTGKICCSSTVLKESNSLHFQDIPFSDLNLCNKWKMSRHFYLALTRGGIRAEYLGYLLSIGGSSCLCWAGAALIPNLAMSNRAGKRQGWRRSERGRRGKEGRA